MESDRCPAPSWEIDYDSYFYNIGYSYIEMAREVARMESETAHITNSIGRHGQRETKTTISRDEARPSSSSHR